MIENCACSIAGAVAVPVTRVDGAVLFDRKAEDAFRIRGRRTECLEEVMREWCGVGDRGALPLLQVPAMRRA
jgi:hypothetical protein